MSQPVCSRLWCTNPHNEKAGCKTQHMPWADGTICSNPGAKDTMVTLHLYICDLVLSADICLVLCVDLQGPRRVEKSGGSNTAMASAGARAYNGGLGQSPQRGPRGQSPRWGVRGRSPPEADEVLVFKTPIFNASATVFHEILHCLS